MEHNDKIKDLFSEKLGNFESSVRPEIWSNIASQIGATTTVATVSTTVSLFTKTIIGLAVAATVGGFAYFAWNKETNQTNKSAAEITLEKNVAKEESKEQSSGSYKGTIESEVMNEAISDNSKRMKSKVLLFCQQRKILWM